MVDLAVKREQVSNNNAFDTCFLALLTPDGFFSDSESLEPIKATRAHLHMPVLRDAPVVHFEAREENGAVLRSAAVNDRNLAVLLLVSGGRLGLARYSKA